MLSVSIEAASSKMEAGDRLTWHSGGLEALQVPRLQSNAGGELQSAPGQGIDGLPVDVSPVLQVHNPSSPCVQPTVLYHGISLAGLPASRQHLVFSSVQQKDVRKRCCDCSVE